MFKLFSAVLVVFVLRSWPSVAAGTRSDSWLQFTREARLILRKCSGSSVNSTSATDRWSCWRRGSLHMLDLVMDKNTIPLTENIRLIRKREGRRSDETPGDGDETKTWSQQVYDKLDNTLSTHVLQIDLSSTFASAGGAGATAPTDRETSRNRRRHQMLPMMMFGITLFGMFFVPIGFQFLSVLGGKAFLMAKMALLLASINGLKRIASSGVHYGLYHTPQGEGFYGGGIGPRFNSR